MQLSDAVKLIEKADLPAGPSIWADLGCGSGFFSAALAQLLPPGSTIWGVDRTVQLLEMPPLKNITIRFYQADFTKEKLPVDFLDGVLMANSLHYVQNKYHFLLHVKNHLADGASVIVVEYNTMQANRWVPYPIDFVHLQHLFAAAGFGKMKKLGERPSVYNAGTLYACQCRK